MKIGEIITNYIVERSSSNLLDEDTLTEIFLNATRYYAGFMSLESSLAVDKDLILNDSEYSLIRPLFLLYVERESATQIEASRGMGVDVFGRSVAEISMEITQYEELMVMKSFVAPIITV